ncbi:MAG TPA: cation:proton antiporter [Polyangiaceae bacterium]|jgi:Kef-type K+ transport system membrane component KefB
MSHGFALPFLVLMLALLVGPPLAKRARLPATVGLVLAGMLVGPHCTGILKGDEIALVAWGTFGLLYLMFSAGLELDVGLLARTKRFAVTFALLSFLVPATLGLTSARLLGYRWPAALLLGSCWGSHTLVTYPMLRAVGLGRNGAVTTVVGGTAVTDTLAMLVLAAVSVRTRGTGSLAGEGLAIGVGLVALAAWTLVVLPHIARWFFAKLGSEHSDRLIFGMLAFLSGAALAEAASIDAIIGAFFAGIGMGRVIPVRSTLMDRVQFFGSTLFIPTFLVSVGVLLDPSVLVVHRTLLLAGVFTVVALGGKTLAALITGRICRFTWAEVGVMSGLSGSQAAATLATTLVGVRLGLFESRTVNAVLIAIFATLVATPALVSFFAKRVARRQVASEALGSSVLVSVRDAQTLPLLGLAASITTADGGIAVAVSIATDDASEAELAAARRLTSEADAWLAKAGFECRSAFRISSSVEGGLREAVRTEEATLLVGEWRSPPLEDAAVRVARLAPVPVLLVHGGVGPAGRLVVVAQPGQLDEEQPGPDLVLATVIVRRLARRRRVTYVGPPAAPLASLFGPRLHLERIETREYIEWLRDEVSDSDWVVLPGLDLAFDVLRRVPELADRRFLVPVAARRSAASRDKHPSSRGGPLPRRPSGSCARRGSRARGRRRSRRRSEPAARRRRPRPRPRR